MQEYLNYIPFYRIAGPMILPLWLCSLVAVMVTLEKTWFFLVRLALVPEQLDQLVQAVQQRDQQSLAALSAGRGPVGLIARSLVAGRDPSAVHRLLGARLDEAAKRLAWLSVVATIAPMLGLLGTVTGMISTFGVLRRGGLGDPVQLAGGINEALYTTALGLAIAVPCYIVFRSLDGLLRQRVRILDDLLDEMFVGIDPKPMTGEPAAEASAD